jgi:hypothetical protein
MNCITIAHAELATCERWTALNADTLLRCHCCYTIHALHCREALMRGVALFNEKLIALWRADGFKDTTATLATLTATSLHSSARSSSSEDARSVLRRLLHSATASAASAAAAGADDAAATDGCCYGDSSTLLNTTGVSSAGSAQSLAADLAVLTTASQHLRNSAAAAVSTAWS